MTAVSIKPALRAGFLLMGAGLFGFAIPGSLLAQDYVDVEAERRAAVDAAWQQWAEQQADLAFELGIGFEDWQRISTLLSTPPPVRIGNQIIMNSVLNNRAIVIDAAVEAAVAQPLHEWERASAVRRQHRDKADRQTFSLQDRPTSQRPRRPYYKPQGSCVP